MPELLPCRLFSLMPLLPITPHAVLILRHSLRYATITLADFRRRCYFLSVSRFARFRRYFARLIFAEFSKKIFSSLSHELRHYAAMPLSFHYYGLRYAACLLRCHRPPCRCFRLPFIIISPLIAAAAAASPAPPLLHYAITLSPAAST
jgi:hypothetical protein